MMDEVERTAYIVWDVFYTCMSERFKDYKGRKEFWGHKHLKAFRRIAELCIQEGYDVADFIRTGLDLLQKNHAYITPKDFATAEAISRYDAYVEYRGDSEPEKSWTSQVATFVDVSMRTIPTFYSDETELLLDMHQPFLAWFRLVYPKQISEPLFQRYARLAWTELKTDSYLRQFVRKNFSEKLAELERRMGCFNDAVINRG